MSPGHVTGPSYWHQQLPDQPLFPDVLWSRPERKALAGKLLIVGGNAYGFAEPAEAFAASTQAGIGDSRVLLPDVLKKTVGRSFAAGLFAPSTPSGSFSQPTLAVLLDASPWADAVLIIGDLGRNSETAIVLEKFIDKYAGPLTLAGDAVDYFTAAPRLLLERPNTTGIVNFSQLQKIAASAAFTTAFTSEMDLLRLAEALHKFTSQYQLNLVIKHLEYLIVAASGEVCSTKLSDNQALWQVKTAAYATVWWLQNPAQTFPALASAVYTVAQLQ
jgi:NAD(P)H-hydrate repair Nnr-like enzyme with NAD(P)H-hydrate dehydratase domain